MSKKVICLLILTSIMIISIFSCGKTQASKNSEEETNLLILLAASRSSGNSITYTGQQSGNQGNSLGFANNVAIATISPSVTGATPSSYAISRTLPTGFSFNTTTGAITGTPTALFNQSSFTVTASYSGSSETKSALFWMTVAGSLSSITCNQSGTAAGCSASFPYSCSNSSDCYAALGSCRNSLSCASF